MQQREFLFGASTSSHQIEGGNTNNDWWEWEQMRPPHLRSGKAADSFRLYKEDIALAKQLGHTAHRLSLEWSRIEPREGKFSREAIEHYRNVLSEVRNAGMKTFVTLHHFTNPIWLSRQGGWRSSRTPELFVRYTKYVTQHLGDLVDFWITINEPMVYALKSYKQGVWPPQQKNIWSTLRVIRMMAKGHIASYRAIHHIYPHVPVGFAQNVIGYAPEHAAQFDDQFIAKGEDFFYNHLFILLIRNTQDFIGLNYYFSRKFRTRVFPPRLQEITSSGVVSDLGLPISPKGLTHILLAMKRYKKPIYVTENGIADADDSKRADFIRSHIRAVEDAQRQGADVRGYLHWSLLDNFEWAEGFNPRFGLIAVDYDTMKRTIRPSAFVYKAIIEQSKTVVS